ncbi:MAG TPA: hypothetical protein VLS96_04740, partial [Nodosilinea sp.]|nr:hypothetical protein [Nodosilinea sp.]
MYTPVLFTNHKGRIKAVTLLLVGYATIFYPRLLTVFGAPSALNFVHFALIPIVTGVVLLTAPLRDRTQARVVSDLAFATGMLL